MKKKNLTAHDTAPAMPENERLTIAPWGENETVSEYIDRVMDELDSDWPDNIIKNTPSHLW